MFASLPGDTACGRRRLRIPYKGQHGTIPKAEQAAADPTRVAVPGRMDSPVSDDGAGLILSMEVRRSAPHRAQRVDGVWNSVGIQLLLDDPVL